MSFFNNQNYVTYMKSGLLIFIVSLLMACGNRLNPMEYNEQIVKMHENTWLYLQSQQELLYKYEDTSREQAKIIIDSMNLKYASITNQLDSINYPCDAEGFHMATVAFYRYMKDSILPMFGKMLEYEPQSQQWYEAWGEIDEALNTRASQLENNMIVEQAKFTKKVSIMY